MLPVPVFSLTQKQDSVVFGTVAKLVIIRMHKQSRKILPLILYWNIRSISSVPEEIRQGRDSLYEDYCLLNPLPSLPCHALSWLALAVSFFCSCWDSPVVRISLVLLRLQWWWMDWRAWWRNANEVSYTVFLQRQVGMNVDFQ